ncbi:MAG: ATP-binding protein [Rhodospirillales bacterium]
MAINARDAMPNGGRLVIEISNAHLDEVYAAQNAEVVPGDYVMVAITDNGIGMPPAVADRAFEPFFTTKDVGQGTGLGLSMVYGFIRQSRGHIKIYSEPSHGTTVRLYVPRLEDAGSVQAKLKSAGPAQHPIGEETILLVEDNSDVRRTIARQLRELGYHIREAKDGREALEMLDADIHLLFTDVVMPGGMLGYELAQRAVLRRPGLKVLFTSGYAHLSLRGDSDLINDMNFSGSPFARVSWR